MATFDLGLSDRDFWESTPKLLSALASRARAREKDAWRRSAMVCAVIANVNRDPKKRRKPYTEDDFLGESKQPQKQTPEQMLAVAKQANALLGGKDMRSNA